MRLRYVSNACCLSRTTSSAKFPNLPQHDSTGAHTRTRSGQADTTSPFFRWENSRGRSTIRRTCQLETEHDVSVDIGNGGGKHPTSVSNSEKSEYLRPISHSFPVRVDLTTILYSCCRDAHTFTQRANGGLQGRVGTYCVCFSCDCFFQIGARHTHDEVRRRRWRSVTARVFPGQNHIRNSIPIRSLAK